MIKHLPNAMTLGNLLCGCIAIVAIMNGEMELSAIMVVVAGILDFFDGFVARLVKSSSELGKQLDSLADMVTFGVVPGLTLFHLFSGSMLSLSELSVESNSPAYMPYFMFAVTLASCLRLAKFNIDIRQEHYFIGVPTPLNALVTAGIPFIAYDNPAYGKYVHNPALLIAYALITSYLMLADIPMISLKVKSWSFKAAKEVYFLLIGSLLMLIILKHAAFPLILCYYVILSTVFPPDKKLEL